MSQDIPALKDQAVLLIEDDYFIMDALRRSFELQGAEIIGPAPTVESALALLAAAPRLDAAVIDINLQGELAFSVANALTERSVPFVFVTGYGRGTVPDRFQHVPRFEKPVQPRDVVQGLAHMLAS